MKTQVTARARAGIAFTLIELLVVIAIIGLLAGLVFPVTRAVKVKAVKTRAQAELGALVLAIEAYKDKLGHYPPDSALPRTNQLYYELLGTKLINNGTVYETLDGSARIENTKSAFEEAFGHRPGQTVPSVTGFINCTRTANADDAPPAKAFLTQLKPNQSAEIPPGIRILACPVQWPADHDFQPIPSRPGLNPWRYISTNPTNNPGAFDLWVDVTAGGKIFRISNWSKEPQSVTTPW
ncbi:MAG TPA: prepilin-type N-terminal cleavage/methylation domain-containing protein [Verrucomicrobiae bacterium]